jgi:hypothetical protein
MEEFLNTPGPALIEAAVDLFELPIPAKVKVEQALHFAESLAGGGPNRTESKSRSLHLLTESRS